jgi:hypothetical protein
MPRIRPLIHITIAPVTKSENLPYLMDFTGLPAGRIFDWLVEKEVKKLKKRRAGASDSGEA